MSKFKTRKEMKTRTVHFTLGENAGRLLVDIAREHLLYSYNPQKALETITGSLTGCPKDIALDIIIGKLILLVDKDRITFNCVPFNPEIHNIIFNRLDAEGWAERKLLDMKRVSNEWRKALKELGKSIVKNNGRFEFTVKYDALLQYFYDGTAGNLIEVDEDDTISLMCGCVKGIKNFVEECFKILNVIDWIYKSYPGEIPDGFTTLPSEVKNLSTELFEIITGGSDIERLIRRNNIADKMLTSYINDEQNIRNAISEGIKPVDILKGWSAGWLSPDGEYYALNGSIANMLHNQIADALVEAKIIPISEIKDEKLKDIRQNPDEWLEAHGWVKIHGDWILYDGWNRESLPGHTAIPMTEKQKEIIYKYGQVCCNGILKLGFMQERISAARFEMTDILMLRKYFEL